MKGKVMYIFEFDICQEREYMHAIKGDEGTTKVRNNFIKIGETGNYEKRLKSYKSNYKCDICREVHFKVYKSWEVDFKESESEDKKERKKIEKKIRKAFPDLHVINNGYETDYFKLNKKSDKEKIKNKMQELIDQKNSNKF